jgi:hypothetical protein
MLYYSPVAKEDTYLFNFFPKHLGHNKYEIAPDKCYYLFFKLHPLENIHYKRRFLSKCLREMANGHSTKTGKALAC